jgi:hypothetical protein
MKRTNRILILILATFLVANGLIFAALSPDAQKSNNGKKDKAKNQIQKIYSGVFDVQKNTVSNFQFYTSNYGIFGLDVANSLGGGYWPRGSANQYIFGGGIWFGAEKVRPGSTDSTDLKKYVEVSYNPNSGKSWMVPGRIEDGDLIDQNDIYKYRTYFSVDFKADGSPIQASDKYNWPVWDSSPADTLKSNHYFGYFIYNTGERTEAYYPKGPAFISGEDIFATFKDTDLNYFEGGASRMRADGYPLRIQYEQTIYSWGFGDYKDFIFIAYNMVNKNSNTILQNCWLAPVMDVDIALSPNTAAGAANDRVEFYNVDPSLNLAIQWTQGDRGEAGKGFGYLGLDFLESPAVDANGFPRHDKRVYSNSEQLGLVTFRNWNIAEDIQTPDERYNFMSSKTRDGDNGAGDKRILMATGPFNMRPNDTVRVVLGVVLANTAKGGDADGTVADVAELIRKDKFAQEVYDNNFRAPTPPDRSIITVVQSLNHGATIQWDSTAEMSYDPYEKGLDFLGFKIYRARRPELDTFNTYQTDVQGPFGWKQIAQFEIPKPYWKSTYRAGLDSNNKSMPLIDQMYIVGPYVDASGKVLDTMAIRVIRCPIGTIYWSAAQAMQQTGYDYPILAMIDTSLYAQPWSPIYKEMLQEDGLDLSKGAIQISNDLINSKHYKIFDSVMVGIVHLNRALIPYNPLFYRRNTIQISRDWLIDSVLVKFPDGIVGNRVINKYYDSINHKDIYDTVRTTVDTVYLVKTLRSSIINGKSGYVVDILTNRSVLQMMNDTTHIYEVLDSLYSYIQRGQVKIDFPDWEQSMRARNEAIVPYVKKNFSNRTLTDIGDDNHDGHITIDTDPTKSEQLVNNVDYYYKVLAYDEGDYQQPTPSKVNDANAGLPNFTLVKPTANTVSDDPDIKVIITPEDSAKIGGLFNFRMFAVDKDRLLKNFAGHTLELKFNPYWYQQQIQFPGRTATDIFTFGLYQQRAQLIDLQTQQTLFDGLLSFEDQPCFIPYRGAFTENGASFVVSDTTIVDSVSGKEITFGLANNREIVTRTGKFTTGSFRDADPAVCYTLSTLPPAYGTLGFGFDFTIQQYGGMYRPDSLTISDKSMNQTNATTPINFIDDHTSDERQVRNTNLVMTTQPVGFDYSVSPNYTIYGSFNNGPGVYQIEFLPGGQDTLNVVWGGAPPKNTNSNTFVVNYLNVKIHNLISYKRPTLVGNDSANVSYPTELQPITLPMVSQIPTPQSWFPDRLYPDPRNLGYNGVDRLNPATNNFIGKYNIGVYGWVNSRSGNYFNPIQLPKEIARPNYEPYKSAAITYLDRQNRYYLSAISVDGKDTIDFNHNLNIGGVQFALDYANKGRFNTTSQAWTPIPVANYVFGPDFQAGDKIVLRTYGGALGLPLPGAKVLFQINNPKGNDGTYTDNLMNNIKVVPNPYFISTEAQKSPYDSEKIFFTSLPKECKIQIFTAAGDLVKTIDHKDLGGSKVQQEYVEPWDLLSSNGIRVQSQAFVALITTPDGAQTVKNFSVVVGGFRLIQQ